MIEKWVNFKRDYLEISFLRENWVCATSPYHRRVGDTAKWRKPQRCVGELSAFC